MFAEPLYKIGGCCKCKKDIWVGEDIFGTIISRLREISSHEYTCRVFGGLIEVAIFECGKYCDGNFHKIRYVCLGKDKKFSYVKESDLKK